MEEEQIFFMLCLHLTSSSIPFYIYILREKRKKNNNKARWKSGKGCERIDIHGDGVGKAVDNHV